MRRFLQLFRWALVFGPFAVVTNASLLATTPVIQGLDDENRVPGQYIVVLKEQVGLESMDEGWAEYFVEEQAFRLAGQADGEVIQRYHGVLQGFAVRASDYMIQEIADDPEVAFVEADRIVTLHGVQSDPPWGLDRIDSRSGLDGMYEFSRTGLGVHAYVIDTGIRSTHNEFMGRMGEGFSSVGDNFGTEDCNGHGTHVAGTVGGTQFGVAKSVTLYPVRVFGCRGSTTNAAILSGIDWVARNAIKPAVVNMSLGGGYSEALNNATQKLVDAGIVTVVAAGNSNGDACRFSPASLPSAISVGSTTSSDQRSSFSNFGACVDIFAPGTSVLSAWMNSDSSTSSISGTSMAAPHVAGAAALILEEFPDASPARITSILIQRATVGKISNPGRDSPNLLLYTGYTDEEPAPEPEPVPDPVPEPDPNNPCGADCDYHYGQVQSGRELIVPESGSFSSTGDIKAYLIVSNGAKFELILQRRNWLFRWADVSSSSGGDGSFEEIAFSGSRGDYRWIVRSLAGTGNFQLYTR